MKLNIHPNLIQNAASHAAQNPFIIHRGATILAMFGQHTENYIEYSELARVCTTNAPKRSLSTAPHSKSSPHGVCTRFPISPKVRTQQLLARADPTVIPHKPCEESFRNGMTIQRTVSGLEDSKVIHAELKRTREAHEALQRQRIDKLKALSSQAERLQASIRDVAHEIDAKKDHYEALISKERRRADDADRARMVAVSSLRSRWEKQKSDLQDELSFLQSQQHLMHKDLKATSQEATELYACWEDFMFDVDVLKRKVAIMEDDDMMRMFSREISGWLSEVSNVILLQPHEGACVVDKLRELHNAVKELVKEVVTRRKNSVRMAEKLSKLEEERRMRIGVEGTENEYHPLM